jgi:uncharacterized protein YndB with AHSA1/START domain
MELATSQDFVLARTFNAPRSLVWKAWTSAEALGQWWGPKGATIRVIDFDLRPGGMFHYAFAFQPGHEMYGRFVYREIVAPERLVFVSSFSDPEGGITRAPFPQLKGKWPLEVLSVMRLTELGGETTLTLRASPLSASEEERGMFTGNIDSMRQGYGGTFDKLSEYLARPPEKAVASKG